jgi:hypothetical protein
LAYNFHDFWFGSTKEYKKFIWELAQEYPEKRIDPN